jgi:hypothetical protein
MTTLLLWVVVLLVAVMLVVELLALLLRLVLGFLLVDPVGARGFGESVCLNTCDGRDGFFGEGVVDFFA